MKMVIYTKNEDLAAKPGWIVRTLYLLGMVHVVICAALGIIFARPFVALWLYQSGVLSQELASTLGYFIGLGLGILAGMISGLVFFALSQALEDLHALRAIVSAYVAVEVDGPKKGE